ncbi:hypothetical protein ABEG63_01995 [Chryseobacterium sp. C39-AII1]|uniref:hypothetical protein n=1 Tax=Chryseobacterium sp. C39-AII1 TaxID=3080332 RepID=UPI003208F5C5
MVKENSLSPIFVDIVEERQIKLLTGKNVNVNFAKKIQNLKIKLGGNFTDVQLYSIEKFYKEDENGELYVKLSKRDIFLTQFYIIFILCAFCIEVILLFSLADQVKSIQNLILYISTIILSVIICFILISLKSNDLTAIYVKQKHEELSI